MVMWPIVLWGHYLIYNSPVTSILDFQLGHQIIFKTITLLSRAESLKFWVLDVLECSLDNLFLRRKTNILNNRFVAAIVVGLGVFLMDKIT